MTITVERIKELLDYSASTGEFRWRRNRAGRFLAGKVAGSIGSHGYVQIGIDGVDYLGHRLAWFVTTGKWPDPEADHKNRCKTDNRFDNLREARSAQNRGNMAVRVDSGSGLKGAHFHKASGLWHGYIRESGRKVSLGYFHSAQEVHEAYVAAAQRVFGEFARAS